MAIDPYEQAMRQEARRLIAQHGELAEVRCVSGPPDYRIELVFADGHEEIITRHSGRIDITMIKFGYMGTGTRCFWAFLDEAGFKDVSLEQLAEMEGPQVLRKGQRPEEAIVEEEPRPSEPAKPPGGEAELPLWAEVSRDPSLVNPLILERLEKSMCFMVRDETGPVAALIVRASPDEFRGPLTAETPMSLYVHYYKAPTCDLYGIYPIVWDDPKQPQFKETWMVGAGRVTGPPDPLSEGELSRLEALLSQKYTYFLIVDPSNRLVAARRVNYSPETQEYFLGFLPKVRAARSVTISNVEFISALGEYMNRVSLEQVTAAARRLSVPEAKAVEAKVICPKCGTRNSPAQEVCSQCGADLLPGRSIGERARRFGISMLFIVLAVLLSRVEGLECLVWLFIALAAFLGGGLVWAFGRTPQYEKYVKRAQRHIEAEPEQALADFTKALELAPEKERAKIFQQRAEICEKLGREPGELDKLVEKPQKPAGVKIVPTRALSGRSIFAGITAVLGVFFFAGFLFTTSATVHDYIKGLEFERIPFQTQVVIILALLAAFLLFAGLSVFLTERRKIGLLFWSGLVVLGVVGTGYVMAYVWEGGLLRTALPSVTPTATAVPRFVTFEGDIFSFEYPSNWEVITEKEIDVLLDTSLKGLSPGGYDYIGGVYTGGVDGCRGCAHIVVLLLKDPNLTGTLTDEQYEQVKASYVNTMGPRLISIERTEVSGMPAVEVVNIGRSKDTRLRGVIIVPPKPGMAYSLSCLSHKDSFDDWEAIFSRAMESLRIGGGAPLTTTPSPAAGVITYTVQAGDTLGKIAAEFGVTVEAIVEANDIEDPSLISVGQVLVIPQP